MPPSRRFLHADIDTFRLSSWQTTVFAAVSLIGVMSFYTLLFYTRELLRIIWTDPIYGDVLVLGDPEMHFWNTICAFLAVLFGQSVFISLWINNVRLRSPVYLRQRLHTILSEQWFLYIISISLLGGLFVRMGIPFFWRTEYVFGLYPDYNIYFILLIAVLFLQQWVTIVRTLRRKGLKWMLMAAVLVGALSLTLSRIDIVDYKKINQQILSSSVYHNYHLDWPQIHDTSLPPGPFYNSRTYIAGNIYIANSVDYPKDKEPRIVMNYNEWEDRGAESPARLKEVEPDSIFITVMRWKEIEDFTKYPGAAFKLKINRNIPMSVVDDVRSQLFCAGVRVVAYTILPEVMEPGYTFRAYEDRLAYMTFLPSPLYDHAITSQTKEQIEQYSNIIEVDVSEGNYVINGKNTAKEEIQSTFRTLILSDDNYIVRYNIAPGSLFEQYVDVVTNLSLAVHDLRAEFAKMSSDQDNSDYFDSYHDMQVELPVRIIEIIRKR